MAFIPGQTGTPARAVDGLEGPTSGSPVTFPAGFKGSQIPETVPDANLTMTIASPSTIVMNPSANRVVTLPTTGVPANYSVTVINRSASFTVAIQPSGGGTITTVGLGQVTVISTQVAPTTTAHWFISSNGAILQGGNSLGATMLVGTNDAQNLNLETNGVVRMTLDTAGNVGIGTASPIALAHINTTASSVYTSTSAGDSLLYVRRETNSGTGTEHAGIILTATSNLGSQAEVYLSGVQEANASTASAFTVKTRTSGGARNEVLRIDSVGSARIGPAAGGNLNHVARSGADTDFSITAAATTNEPRLSFYRSTTNDAFLAVGSSTNGILTGATAGHLNIVTTGSNRAINFSTDGTTIQGSMVNGAWTLGPTAGGVSHVMYASNNTAAVHGFVLYSSAALTVDTATNYIAASGRTATGNDAQIGVRKNTGLNATAYLGLRTADNVQNWMWVDDNNNFRISTNISHIGSGLGTFIGGPSASGRYTPTVVIVTNVASVGTPQSSLYSRVGNIVTVSIYIASIDPSGVGNCRIRVSLPIASNFTTTGDTIGTASAVRLSATTNSAPGVVYTDATNDNLDVYWIAPNGDPTDLMISAQYEVK